MASTTIQNEEEEDTRFVNDPEGKFRMYSLISYVLVIMVIGFPMWWLTTRVYRAPLPLDEMLDYDISAKTIRENSIPLSLEYDVLVSIVHPEPQNLMVDINSADLKLSLKNYLEKIAKIADFTMKTQWLYLVNLGVRYSNMDKFIVIEENQLPLIINNLEKKMWSHMSPRPVLNLVLYISPCTAMVKIRDSRKNFVESNSFLNPRWGGITVVNPDDASCEEGTFKPNFTSILPTFANHLKNLIGLKGNSPADVKRLMDLKSLDMIKSTRRTLKSLALLLSEISSIVISDEVALKVHTALENANMAEEFIANDDYVNGLAAAKIAYYNSEAAFSDPSLLALLYFPDDQKYAVYIPLFLPVLIPVFISLINFKKWIEKNKKVKEE